MRRRDRRGDGPDGSEPRTPAAAAVCAERGIAWCLLLASPEEARAETRTLPDAVQAAQST